MNEEKGFIKIYRSLTEWEWWSNHNTTRLFIYCLLAANWKDKSWQGHKIKRGQFVTSLPDLSQKTGLSREQIRNALKHLISTGNITDKSYSKFRIITVKNYDAYQDDNRIDNSQVTVKQQSSNSQVTPTKEGKKERKEEREEKRESKERESAVFTVSHTPPPDDVLFLGDYGNVRISSAELERFEKEFPTMANRTIQRLSQYMAENGKSYTNHYAVLCRWAKEDAERERQKAVQEAVKRTYDIEAFDNIDFTNTLDFTGEKS